MVEGRFYFLEDRYYSDYSGDNNTLMGNSKEVNGEVHGRPCFCAFKDSDTDLYWMIPVSSRVEKFKAIFDKKVAKRGRCDTIVFGELLGKKCAFLIQNMCHVTEDYIKEEYINNGVPVAISGNVFRELREKAMKILKLQRKGHILIYSDVLSIEQNLLAKKASEEDVSSDN